MNFRRTGMQNIKSLHTGTQNERIFGMGNRIRPGVLSLHRTVGGSGFQGGDLNLDSCLCYF
jgi:hypothetical protein